jgi:hypothetical protein
MLPTNLIDGFCHLSFDRWCLFRISSFGFRALPLAMALGSLIALPGCGDGQGTVNGAVTLDGQPVAHGTVTFVSNEGGKLVREGAVIEGGSFHAVVPPGEYKIELNGQKVVGKRKQKGFDGKDEELEITEELFPERYNAKTELTAKVSSGTNTVKLDVKGAK